MLLTMYGTIWCAYYLTESGMLVLTKYIIIIIVLRFIGLGIYIYNNYGEYGALSCKLI